MADLDQLLAAAANRPVDGWDFSWLGRRMAVSRQLPWDYTSMVSRRCRHSPDLLDMGTGGGEWLSQLPYRPPLTVATECWQPNLPVAAARLWPLGITVIRPEDAPENPLQVPGERRGALPFRSGAFHLVVNRHESYLSAEVARVLANGGRFLTQQVCSGHSADLHALLGLPAPALQPWNLNLAVAQATSAGLDVVDGGEDHELVEFADVGALAWYLKAVPWEVPGFDPDRHRARLAELHVSIERNGPLRIRLPHFWPEAIRPA